MARRLERALARLGRRRAATAPDVAQPRSGTAFRAAVDERLRDLERQMEEVKGRVNSLLLIVAGTVLAEVIRGLVR
ncbi:MAG: hypothetical protein ACE5IZ_06380 [Dehalococcoidia bacterium]